MKLVISSDGNTIDSEIDPRFGRCRYFIIVETENKEIKEVSSVENQGVIQGHGAGIRAGQQVGEINPDAIITGNLGPNALNVIRQLNIDAYQATGTVKTAVKDFIEGKLKKMTSNVGPHFGMN